MCTGRIFVCTGRKNMCMGKQQIDSRFVLYRYYTATTPLMLRV